jgi:hypothetical protein
VNVQGRKIPAEAHGREDAARTGRQKKEAGDRWPASKRSGGLDEVQRANLAPIPGVRDSGELSTVRGLKRDSYGSIVNSCKQFVDGLERAMRMCDVGKDVRHEVKLSGAVHCGVTLFGHPIGQLKMPSVTLDVSQDHRYE